MIYFLCTCLDEYLRLIGFFYNFKKYVVHKFVLESLVRDVLKGVGDHLLHGIVGIKQYNVESILHN